MTTAVASKRSAAPARKARTRTIVVNFVLDETGSMGVCRDATISGFNEYVDGLAKRKERLLFTLTKFNADKIEVVHAGVPVKEVAHLNQGTYMPDALTPLYDAIAKTIHATEEALKAEKGKPSVLCVIMTDGEENASTEYKREGIFSLIKAKEAEGWTFAYLGANQDAWAVGQSIGMHQGNTMDYVGDPQGTVSAMGAAGSSTGAYVSSRGAQTQTFFGDSRNCN